jgi:hypothetical protein
MANLPHALKATVERIEEEHIVLKTEDGQTLKWPIKLVHGEIGEGDTVDLLALSNQQSEKERKNIARHVLNELLGGSTL